MCVNETYCSDHLTTYTNIKSSCSTTEANIKLYDHYLSVQKHLQFLALIRLYCSFCDFVHESPSGWKASLHQPTWFLLISSLRFSSGAHPTKKPSSLNPLIPSHPLPYFIMIVHLRVCIPHQTVRSLVVGLVSFLSLHFQHPEQFRIYNKCPVKYLLKKWKLGFILLTETTPG